MRKVSMILAALPVLFVLPAAAQAPPPQPTAAERAAQSQAAIEAAKAPPVEDFKPSDLNQKGKAVSRGQLGKAHSRARRRAGGAERRAGHRSRQVTR